jgi:hypothetical protein
MLEMFLPVGGVLPGERRIANGEEVFRILLLGRLGEIEAPDKDRVAIDNHNLVVSNGVLGVDPDGNTGVGQKRRRRIRSGSIAAADKNPHLHPASVASTSALAIGAEVKL